MESGLECEGVVEGTINEMALREERDGFASGNRGARAASRPFPAALLLLWPFTYLLPFSSCEFPSPHLLGGSRSKLHPLMRTLAFTPNISEIVQYSAPHAHLGKVKAIWSSFPTTRARICLTLCDLA